MFLKCTPRKKDGKEHRYWSIVENKRIQGNRVVQRHVLYLGEINSSQQEAWKKTIEILEHGQTQPKSLSLFPEDRAPETDDESVVRIRLDALELRHPRQWGSCWVACELYRELGLDSFWKERLESSRKGTPWDRVLQTMVAYRLIAPGSEWRLHRHWFQNSALADLLGDDFRLAADDTLYRCHDYLLEHKEALFTHLTERWRTLFQASYEVLLYDLTSTYFESNPPFAENDKRKFGYSRDKRSDCVQVVIALVVTTEGFPLAYEVMDGNTIDNQTLRPFLAKIEKQYGKADRIWVMDRGIPTEAVLEEMRQSQPPVSYLVGTPKGRLTKLEQALTDLPWQKAREGVDVKLLPQDQEIYVFAKSQDRVQKERAMRKSQLKRLWKRLHQIKQMGQDTRRLLLALGGAKKEYPSAWRLVDITYPSPEQPDLFAFKLDRKKMRKAYRREGRYLLRTNLKSENAASLWEKYIQLTQVEEAFRNLKGDMAVRPVYHQKMERVEAHIFISFIAYCMHVTLRQKLRRHAPGLTPRTVLEKFAGMQMIDVHLPTTDGRTIVLTRFTNPDKDQQLLIEQLKWKLPEQPPPRINPNGTTLEN